jgi:predicted nucleotidyltransferase
MENLSENRSYQDLVRVHPGPLNDWAILTAWRGSVAHNMYVPGSDPGGIDDKDLMAVCVPPPDHYFGLAEFGSRGTIEIKEGEWDIVAYEARKMMRLLRNGNPNALSVLWTRPEHRVRVTPAGQLLLDHRDVFTGKHVYQSFVGYAREQLKRMTHLAFQGYMGEKRKRLVEKHGYDTKNAAHLIRLLRMGIEFLRDGVLNVFREDAEELLRIKKGEWSLERVKKEADGLFLAAEKAHAASSLPEQLAVEAVGDLCVRVVQLGLKGAG